VGGRWLDDGHGDGHSLAPVKSVLAPGNAVAELRRNGARRSRPSGVVAAAVAVVALIGSAGTAYAVRGTLFPSLGAPTARSVWQNFAPVDEPAAVAVMPSKSSRPSTTTSATSATLPSTTTPTDSISPLSSAPLNTSRVESGGSQPVADGSGSIGSDPDDSDATGSDPGSGVTGSDPDDSDATGSDLDDSDATGSGSAMEGSDDSSGTKSGRSGSGSSSSSGDVDELED